MSNRVFIIMLQKRFYLLIRSKVYFGFYSRCKINKNRLSQTKNFKSNTCCAKRMMFDIFEGCNAWCMMHDLFESCNARCMIHDIFEGCNAWCIIYLNVADAYDIDAWSISRLQCLIHDPLECCRIHDLFECCRCMMRHGSRLGIVPEEICVMLI